MGHERRESALARAWRSDDAEQYPWAGAEFVQPLQQIRVQLHGEFGAYMPA